MSDPTIEMCADLADAWAAGDRTQDGQRAARGIAERIRETFRLHRNSGAGGNDPQECAWPHCGCDPAANRVLEHIQECGFVIVRESDVTTLRELLAQAAPGTGPDEVWDKRRREALADTK
jgi:hypothetical protein